MRPAAHRRAGVPRRGPSRAAAFAPFAAAVLAASFRPGMAAEGGGTLEGRAHAYRDDARLYVSSVEGAWTHPLPMSLTLSLRAVADWITILPPPAGEAADPHAGHGPGHEHIEEYDNPMAPDAVSGASARASAGSSGSRELRAGGGLGLAWRGRRGNIPVTLAAEARGSGEPDYRSASGTVSGSLALFRGNTSVSGFAGLGWDETDPAQPPPGQSGAWPASQSKVSAGLGVSQDLSPRLTVSAGASAAIQSGRLSSPYRNSLVGITYFPEKLPEDRMRATAFATASLYLGRGAALHLREGFYADDWGVRAWIPEAALAKEWGRWLATLRHRFYAQVRADFYRPVYGDRKGYRAGDARLGRLYDQTGALSLEYRLGPRARPAFLSVGYSFSHLEYPDLHPRTLISHVFGCGVRAEY